MTKINNYKVKLKIKIENQQVLYNLQNKIKILNDDKKFYNNEIKSNFFYFY